MKSDKIFKRNCIHKSWAMEKQWNIVTLGKFNPKNRNFIRNPPEILSVQYFCI